MRLLSYARNDGKEARNDGFILLPVVMAMTLIAAIAFLLNREGAMNAEFTASKTDAAKVEYVTRAGLAHAGFVANNSYCSGDLTIPGTDLDGDSYTATVTAGGPTARTTISVDQDSWLKEASPTENRGSDNSLTAKNQSGDGMRPVYRFDLAAIPLGTPINSAVAWFYVKANDDEAHVTVHRITADWTESDATWGTIGDQFDAQILAAIPAQTNGDVWVQLNITAQVQAWVNGAEPNYGIMLIATSNSLESRYMSREASASEQPYLEVIVGTGGASPATISAIGTLANGVTRTIERTDIPVYQPKSYTVMQPGAAEAEDAEIWDQNPDINYGNTASTWVSSATNDTTRTLLRFNAGAIPYGARILDATLSLHLRENFGPAQPVSAHRIRNPWSEASVTWNSRETSTNWDTAGGDFDGTAVATTPVGTASDQRYEWSITSLVQGWVDGSYPNHGVVLVAAIPGMDGKRFYNSDDSDPTWHPRLSITYACECGIACIIPEGSGNVLMVVGDDTNLHATDASRKELIEAWGYTVNLLDHNANPGLYAAGIVNNDVIYVSGSVTSAIVGTQLSAVPIGIVNEESALNDELGISSGESVPVGASIDVVDNTHYITALFPPGPLNIYTANMKGVAVGGTEAPGLRTLAQWGSVNGLVVLDTGAMDTGGSTIPGRRVLLPTGKGNEIDWDSVNHNGRLILQRAIQWGIGNLVVVASDPIILSTLANATLGGLSFTDNDLVEYDPVADTATMIFDGSTTTLVEDINAFHLLANGHYLLSTRIDAMLGGLAFGKDDLIDYDPVADTAVLIFDGGALFTASDEDIDAVFMMDNGHLLLSTENEATLGGLTFDDDELAEYDPVADTATLFFSDALFAGDEDIDGVHLLDNGHIILSNNDNSATLGGLTFDDDDLVDYDPVTDTATLYFDGSGRFSASDEDVISVHIGPGSGNLAPLPIAHWKLDEGSGTDAVDSVGSHDGILFSTPVWGPGKIDGGLSFDTPGDAVTVAHQETLSLTETFTFTAWANANVYGTFYSAILNKADASGTNYWFGVLNDELLLDFYVGGTWHSFETSGANLVAGTWYHVAASFDNATDSVRLYINGIETFNGVMSVTPEVNTVDVRIGNSGFSGEYWPGTLDEVRIYNQVLGATEIADLAAQGSGGGGGGGGGGDCDGTYRDEFNSRSYSNNDGTLAWATDWLEINESDGPTSGDEQVRTDLSSYQLRIKDNDGGGEGAQREADLSGAGLATLSLEYSRLNLDNSNDYVVLEISANGDAGPWVELDRFEGPGTDPTYVPANYDISAYIAANTRIRMVTSPTMGRNDIVWFDNVEIQCSP